MRDRNLMGAPSPLNRLAVHELWPRPAFWCAEDDHGPARPFDCVRRGTSRFLNLLNFRQDSIERASQTLMHYRGEVAFDKMRLITVAVDQVGQFLAADTREHGRICDLESVEMKDWKNRPVARGIKKFVGVPTGGQGARLRLAVTNDAGHDQIRIVECRAVGVEQGIT